MPCTIVNSQSQLQARLPTLPGNLPTTQAGWTAFLRAIQQWGQALQQQPHPPNVIPSQFQTFTRASQDVLLAALNDSHVTVSVDNTHQYYGSASLLMTPTRVGATFAFAGTPISISPATRWFCSFQVLTAFGFDGSLTVTTNNGNSVTETFSIPGSANWQQVWGLFDLSQWADTQATWTITFTTTSNVNLDGLQMNDVGQVLAYLPKFSGSQMILGGLAYGSTTDDVPPGTSTTVATTLAVIGNQRNMVPDSGLKAPSAYWSLGSPLFVNAAGPNGENIIEYIGTGSASGFNIAKSLPIPIAPGTYTLSAQADGANILSGSAGVFVFSTNVVTNYGGLTIASGSSGRLSATITIPSGVSEVVVIFDTDNCTVQSGAALFAWQLQLEPGGTMTAYQETTGDQITGSLIVNPAVGGVMAKGAVPPFVFNPSISYTSTTSSISLSWAAFTVYRMDGSSFTVSAGSQNITGLAANTNYTFYPYVVDGATTLSFATGFTGHAGTPAIAYAGGSAPAANGAYSQGNIPFNAFQAVTPSSGTGGGGGDTIGCLHPDTEVQLADGRLMHARDLWPNMELPAPDGPAKIVRILRKPCLEWWRVFFHDGSSSIVTGDHRFIHPDKNEIRARDLRLGSIVAGRNHHLEVIGLYLWRQRADVISIELEAPHLYYLDGALSHNVKP